LARGEGTLYTRWHKMRSEIRKFETVLRRKKDQEYNGRTNL
jgi:hypothetical protein